MPLTYRYEIAREYDSEVSDVDSTHSRLIKDVQADNSILLELNGLTGIEGRRGKVGRGRCREMGLHLRSGRERESRLK